MDLVVKALIGAVVVIVIGLLSKTRNYFIAGMVPLFPTFALIAHYIVGTTRTRADLKATVLFGLCSMAPYVAYLLAVYFLIDRLPLVPTLASATGLWCLVAVALVMIWSRMHQA